MQAMTPEQEEQWREAILVDGSEPYLEKWKALPAFAALLPEPAVFLRQSLQPSEERLKEMGVPDWAIQFRTHCIFGSWTDGKDDSHWVPEFLLRSETALRGFALQHSCHAEATLAYQRLGAYFVCEQLRPFVEHARKVGWRRRGHYKPVVKLFRLCECYLKPGSALTWPKHLDSLPKRVLRGWSFTVEFLFQTLLFLFDVSLLNGKGDTTIPFFHEGSSAADLSENLFEAITGILNPNAYPGKSWDVGVLVNQLETQHRWSRDGKEDSDRSYTDLVAAAFLAALEAECPPPDWLPRA